MDQTNNIKENYKFLIEFKNYMNHKLISTTPDEIFFLEYFVRDENRDHNIKIEDLDTLLETFEHSTLNRDLLGEYFCYMNDEELKYILENISKPNCYFIAYLIEEFRIERCLENLELLNNFLDDKKRLLILNQIALLETQKINKYE